jgi:hypothetical protein
MRGDPVAIMSTLRRSAAAIGVAASVVLAAASVVLAAAPAAAASPSPVPSASPRPDTAPVVRVLDVGMEPRSELRYVFQPGQMDMAMDIEMHLRASSDNGAPAVDVTLPPMHVEVSIVLGKGSPTGTARYDYAYTAATVGDPGDAPAELVTILQDRLTALVGVTGWAVVDDRGRTIDAGLTGLDNLDAATRALVDDAQESFKDASAPLPEEPVGVGARWVVEQHLPSQGLVVDQDSTFHLDGRDGDVLHLSVDVTQSATPGPLDLPESSPGGLDQATLIELSGRGSGTMLISLRDVVPTSHLTSQGHSVLESGGTRVTSDTTLSARIGPAVSSPPVPSDAPSESPSSRADY